MKKFSVNLFSVLVLLVPIIIFAQDPVTLFEQARHAYDEGNYEESVNLYRKILLQGRESASVHYNLGNAYFRTGELGEAILHFEKAKRLNPRNKDITHNLEIARVRVQDRITPPGKSLFMQLFDGIKYLFNLNELAIIVTLLFMIGSLNLAAWKLLPGNRLKNISGYVLAVCTALFVLSTPMLVSRTLEAYGQSQGIVLDTEIRAHSAPQNFSTEVFVIHEGTKVTIVQEQHDWYQISLLDGKEGWIPVDSIGII